MGGVSTGAFIRGVSGVPDSGLLFQSAIPFILAGGTAGAGTNQFTAGAAGAISTLPTLPTTYSGGAWLYLPAGTYAGQAAAGWYWFVASSTTAGTVYNNRYISGDPRLAVPTTLTPFGAGVGLVTQTVGSQIAAQQITVPGGSMGPNGSIRYTLLVAHTAYTTQNVYAARFGAIDATSNGLAVNSTTVPVIGMIGFFQSIFNANAVNRQVVNSFVSDNNGVNTLSPSYGTMNTANDVVFETRLQLGAATNFALLNALRVELFYGA